MPRPHTNATSNAQPPTGSSSATFVHTLSVMQSDPLYLTRVIQDLKESDVWTDALLASNVLNSSTRRAAAQEERRYRGLLDTHGWMTN